VNDTVDTQTKVYATPAVEIIAPSQKN